LAFVTHGDIDIEREGGGCGGWEDEGEGDGVFIAKSLEAEDV
jgi:hypothetical protein